jgi:hypothetical protein
LHSEEEGIIERREKGLVDYDFRRKGQNFGGIIEIVSEEQKPGSIFSVFLPEEGE